MLYLGPKVSTLFSLMWCKSGNHMRGPTPPYFTPSSLFTLICLTFTLNYDVYLFEVNNNSAAMAIPTVDPWFVLGLCTITLLWMWYMSNKKRYTNLPPIVPGSHHFLGHILTFIDHEKFCQDMMSYSQELGPIVHLEVPGDRVVVVLNSLQLIKEAFVKKADCFSSRPDWLNGPRLMSNMAGNKIINYIFYHCCSKEPFIVK